MAVNTIELITEAFDQHQIKYKVIELENLSLIDAGYNITGGPTVRFHFLSQSEENNDVQVRINGILHKVSKEKRPKVLEACNRINSEMRFIRGIQILDRCYHYFPEAYYSTPGAEKNELLLNTLNALQDLRDNPVTIPPEEK